MDLSVPAEHNRKTPLGYNGDHFAAARKTALRIRRTLAQAARIQELMYDEIVALPVAQASQDESLNQASRARAQALCGLTRAWDTARNAIRVRQGVPLPGSRQQPAQEQPKRRRRPSGPQPPGPWSIPPTAPLRHLPAPDADRQAALAPEITNSPETVNPSLAPPPTS